jgi:hypothetical protein
MLLLPCCGIAIFYVLTEEKFTVSFVSKKPHLATNNAAPASGGHTGRLWNRLRATAASASQAGFVNEIGEIVFVCAATLISR